MKKYETIRTAGVDGGMKAAAWRTLARKCLAWSAAIPEDRPEALLAKALDGDGDGEGWRMAIAAGFRVVVRPDGSF